MLTSCSLLPVVGHAAEPSASARIASSEWRVFDTGATSGFHRLTALRITDTRGHDGVCVMLRDGCFGKFSAKIENDAKLQAQATATSQSLVGQDATTPPAIKAIWDQKEIIETYVKLARKTKERGLRGFKIHPYINGTWNPIAWRPLKPGERGSFPEQDLQIIRAVYAELGNSMPMMFDPGWQYNLDEAIRDCEQHHVQIDLHSMPMNDYMHACYPVTDDATMPWLELTASPWYVPVATTFPGSAPASKTQPWFKRVPNVPVDAEGFAHFNLDIPGLGPEADWNWIVAHGKNPLPAK
jgi:hypothetical protein